ncbi:hypothetical protein LK994_00975 [Ferruginibacter lapsinanis]|uniref:hypothetical protein n=1 Tax=Ferruginibacter lapsinanis TaxID=563172 RepID=UPI001E3FD420|nr:hypothetical protein [Ferruginibacter lapsinanis]UEG50046.1 hypothetical protein LK994_00975 [Ferruginibacter lapsinanis]
MKPNNFFAAAIIAACTLLAFSACNSGGNKEKENTMDTTANKMEPVATKPGNTLIVIHKVANYAKWKPIFDSDDSAQKAHSLTKFTLGRGMDDSNMVLIAFRMPDTAQAKAFAASPELKAKMGKAGVIGAPSMTFYNVVMLDTTTNSITSRVIMTHKVKDWDAWKKEFDSHKQARTDAGLVDRAVGYSIDDNHIVTVVCAITDMAKAKAFFKSADLKEKMAKAGVEGEPKAFFYNVVETY